MKLNPPASSSDLDAARAIARRLHRRALGHQRATDVTRDDPGVAEEPTPPPDAEEVEHVVFPDAAAEVEVDLSEPTPSEPRLEAATPAAPEPGPFEQEPAVASEPAPAESGGEEAFAGPADTEGTPFEPTAPEAAAVAPPGAASEDEASGPPEAPDAAGADHLAPPVEPPTSLPGLETPAAEENGSDPWATQATPAEGTTAPPEIDPDSALSGLGVPDEPPSLEGLEPPPAPPAAAAPEDLVDDAAGSGWPDGNPLEAEIGGDQSAEPERAPDDLVAPPTPSWDDVADSCLAVAGAHGAMLVDPAARVLSARGDWPEPGPEAIGGRLVSMMEKTLKDAPTRSVSAPLAGRHLTAWRVPATEGYLTVVFMGDAPLGADVRSPVDVEIRRALGQ